MIRENHKQTILVYTEPYNLNRKQGTIDITLSAVSFGLPRSRFCVLRKETLVSWL